MKLGVQSTPNVLESARSQVVCDEYVDDWRNYGSRNAQLLSGATLSRSDAIKEDGKNANSAQQA
jgi:hypothetical protein